MAGGWEAVGGADVTDHSEVTLHSIPSARSTRPQFGGVLCNTRGVTSVPWSLALGPDVHQDSGIIACEVDQARADDHAK